MTYSRCRSAVIGIIGGCIPRGDRLGQTPIQAVPAALLLDKQAWDGPVEQYGGEAGTQVLAAFAGALPPSTAAGGPGAEPAGDGGTTDLRMGSGTNLRVQKQAGLDGLPLKVTVTAPAGFKLAAAGRAGSPWRVKTVGSGAGSLSRRLILSWIFVLAGK